MLVSTLTFLLLGLAAPDPDPISGLDAEPAEARIRGSDASVQVLQGIIFVAVLASDALYGRIGFLKGKS